MKKIKIFLVILSICFVACDSPSDCLGEQLCQQKNVRIISVISELNDIGKKIECQEEMPDTSQDVKNILEKIQNNEELATIASISRSMMIYESYQLPSCYHSRSDNVFDHAFWISIKKIAKSQDSKSKEYLQKLKEKSDLDPAEERYFDEITNNKL